MLFRSHRPADEQNTYWRVGQFIFPCWAMAPINPFERNVLARAYVPLDDENTMIVMMYMKRAYLHDRYADNPTLPGSSQRLRFRPNTTDALGRYRLEENIENDYKIDRDLQRSGNYTGINGITLQDQAVTESMGRITDRTFEHLAPSDVAVNRMRRQLVRAANSIAKDGAIVGSVETVTREINNAMKVSGCNYLVGRFAFGNMTYQDTRRSVDLFTNEVMPNIQ